MKSLLALARMKQGAVEGEDDGRGGWKGAGRLKGGWAGGRDLGMVEEPVDPNAMPDSTDSDSDSDSDDDGVAYRADPVVHIQKVVRYQMAYKTPSHQSREQNFKRRAAEATSRQPGYSSPRSRPRPRSSAGRRPQPRQQPQSAGRGRPFTGMHDWLVSRATISY